MIAALDALVACVKRHDEKKGDEYESLYEQAITLLLPNFHMGDWNIALPVCAVVDPDGNALGIRIVFMISSPVSKTGTRGTAEGDVSATTFSTVTNMEIW